MNINDIKTVGILGSGTMGSGIGISCIIAGYKVVLYDISDEVLGVAGQSVLKNINKAIEKGKLDADKKNEVLDRMDFTKEFSDLAKADFVIEAVPEIMDLKKDIFKRLDSTCNPNIILATNTSSLSVTTISTAVQNNRERVVGMHFFNPANIMKLVEVIRGDFTSDEAVNATIELSKKIGKVPVNAKDTPAFIVNRIARPYYGESLRMLAEGTAGFEKIDKVLRTCGGFAMGPFQLMDLIGIDVNFSVTKSVFEAYFDEPKYRPSYIQRKMVDANLLGRKTKRGFYKYD
ncbi:MAG: 3-hydroxybutyryl-CoA dehydrogenase [Ignavibacteriae bacterium]|nr:3-hydroxybutyryl-CoA dehydrogenase [Ignavibacteriota bacterium]MCB9242364.1 3-hydroxybutyryl-CoA dehydrogenase [Ignavibacteriales bacterium]